jgi:7SK snRNA methylphosphate capping enzyme
MNHDRPCSSNGGPLDTQSSKGIGKKNKDRPTPLASNGNFKNYYAIRRDVRQEDRQKNDDKRASDKRVEAITTWINSHKMVEGVPFRRIETYLDIGCNTGQCTFELAQYLNDQPKHVIGIDIDEDLVRQARITAKSYGYRNNLQSSANQILGSGRVGYSIDQPRKRLRLEESAEAYVSTILTCDWTYNNGLEEDREKLIKHNSEGYDLITALSVTKWIQLEHADAGIRVFFARICNSLKSGGLFILEPQPFKSYKGLHKITKPSSRERQNIAQMKIFPDDFPWILTIEFGLIGPFFIRCRGQNGFIRDIQAYLQPAKIDSKILLHRKEILRSTKEECYSFDTVPWVQRDRQQCV